MKAYKVEIDANYRQIKEIDKSISACRFLYNFYLESCKKIYSNFKKYVSAEDFFNLITKEYIEKDDNFKWLSEIRDFSLIYNIKMAEKELYKFYSGERNLPSFKRKMNNSVKLYINFSENKDITIERHRVKIGTLGWIKLKEYGYIPSDKPILKIFISKKIGKYYLTVVTDELSEEQSIDKNASINNISDKKRIYLRKKLAREQRSLARKYKALSERTGENKPTRQNINKQIVRIQKIKNKLGML